MGEKRTLNAVAAELQKSYTLIRRWKETWNWEERVRAYDNDLQKEAHKKAIKEKKNMVDRQIRLATLMQDKALEALEYMDTKDMDPRALVALVNAATSLERKNREDAVLQAAPATEDGAGPGSGSLADMITAAWERRKNGEHT